MSSSQAQQVAKIIILLLTCLVSVKHAQLLSQIAIELQVINETRELWSSSAELASKSERINFFEVDFLKPGRASS